MSNPRSKQMLMALMFVAFFAWNEGPGVREVSARSYDWCYNSCDNEASCDTECEADGGGTTTCGAYDGGPANDWCDGNTCDNVCSLLMSGSTECYHQDEPTDCAGYGLYATCGDDVCAFATGVESCSNCDDDCGECRVIPCGDDLCEYGESYRTCPADCDEPISEYCGDGICSVGETPANCYDCEDPEEYCDGINHVCPVDYQCVSNYCSYENTSVRQVCDHDDPEHPHEDCPVGYRCEAAMDLYTYLPVLGCYLERRFGGQ